MYKRVFASALMLIGINQVCSDQSVPLRGPPVVEKAPILLSSFLPASMQIIAHLTDLMKYEIRPSGGTVTTTTVRPTPHHRPGIYSPRDPLGPAAYFARGTSYEEYVQRLKSPQGSGYFDRYRYPLGRSEQGYVSDGVQAGLTNNEQSNLKGGPKYLPPSYMNMFNVDLDLLGQGPSNLLKQVNRIDDYDFVDDDDDNVQRFFDNYDDSNLRSYVTGNKKIPPTRAYVTMLSLYDLLNKESKKLQLNKYGGYTNEVLRVLAETSTGTAADQLHKVLSKVVERRDTKDQQIINKIKALIKDLEQSDSYINDALRYIPPLQFTA